MELKEITCIVCPLGCRIQVEMEGGEIKSVKGYSCSRGLEYAKNEVTMPKRTITTSVRAIGDIFHSYLLEQKSLFQKKRYKK